MRRFSLGRTTLTAAVVSIGLAGVLLKNVTESRVSDCLISNELGDVGAWVPLKVIGGGENTIVDNRTDGR